MTRRWQWQPRANRLQADKQTSSAHDTRPPSSLLWRVLPTLPSHHPRLGPRPCRIPPRFPCMPTVLFAPTVGRPRPLLDQERPRRVRRAQLALPLDVPTLAADQITTLSARDSVKTRRGRSDMAGRTAWVAGAQGAVPRAVIVSSGPAGVRGRDTCAGCQSPDRARSPSTSPGLHHAQTAMISNALHSVRIFPSAGTDLLRPTTPPSRPPPPPSSPRATACPQST